MVIISPYLDTCGTLREVFQITAPFIYALQALMENDSALVLQNISCLAKMFANCTEKYELVCQSN